MPGSVFTVFVAKVWSRFFFLCFSWFLFFIPGAGVQDDSIGGAGNVVVFFSSTSSTQKGRDDFFTLQNLFKTKEIHLREDFSPWVAIDVLDKTDRDAIFVREERAFAVLF